MYRLIFTAVLLGALAGSPQLIQAQEQAPKGDTAKQPESLKQKYSYLLGYNMIKDMKREQIDFDLKELVRGITEASDGKSPTMSDEEIQAVFVAFERMMIRKQEEMLAQLADENKRKGAEFLQTNLTKDGVKELENGVQYKVNKQGDGEFPRITDTVKVSFKAMDVEGNLIASTPANQPETLTVGSVPVRGIATALQKMKPGGNWTVYIPSDQAFGFQGNRQLGIGPNQSMIYELNLIEIVK